jgi:hypothetical protein
VSKELIQLLNISKKKYKAYVDNGKTFYHAKEIKLINIKILALIQNQNYNDNIKLQETIINLIQHIEEWILIWNKKEKSKKPKNDDVFIFDGYKKYPKKLDKLLINV